MAEDNNNDNIIEETNLSPVHNNGHQEEGPENNVEETTTQHHSNGHIDELEQRIMALTDPIEDKLELLRRLRIHRRLVAGRNNGNGFLPNGNIATRNQNAEENGVGDEDLLAKMPTVTSMNVDGERMEGFLYKYKEGEVIIVCVCHVLFLSPREFVQHAGCDNVQNPLRHIRIHGVPARS